MGRVSWNSSCPAAADEEELEDFEAFVFERDDAEAEDDKDEEGDEEKGRPPGLAREKGPGEEFLESLPLERETGGWMRANLFSYTSLCLHRMSSSESVCADSSPPSPPSESTSPWMMSK